MWMQMIHIKCQDNMDPLEAKRLIRYTKIADLVLFSLFMISNVTWNTAHACFQTNSNEFSDPEGPENISEVWGNIYGSHTALNPCPAE